MANNLNARLNSFRDDTNALATDLIALLDRYIFLEGCTLTSNPTRPETTLPPVPCDDTPIAVQMYATPSLSAHLVAHEQDVQERATITARIATLTKHPSVAQAAHELLDAEFASLPTALFNPRTSTSKNLAPKVATLRSLQQRACQPLRPPEFKTSLVTAANGSSGTDAPFTTIYLPCTIPWQEYAETLTKYAQHDLATVHDLSGERSSQKDEWHYQYTKFGRLEGRSRELACEADFRELRRGMGKEGIGVLVWHPRILAASLAWKGGDDDDEDEGGADWRDVDLEASVVDFGQCFAQEG